uniref:RNA-binding protein 40 n=1 Tax=Ceratitis capitata TaxID=7213 RepID=W8C6J0_CERCA
MDNSANTLLIKNLPKSVSDISSILPTKPLEVKPFGRQRMLISYANEVTAQNVLEQLQQIEVAPGKRLNAIIFRKMAKSNVKAKIPAKATTTSRSTQTKLQTSDATVLPEISKYVSKLYACESKLNFEQPPPPYLKYAYPRITPDILDAISIALMSNTRFYTQVLHLMNRMNLEPPFAAKPKGVRLTCGWPRNVATQTTEEIVVVAKSEGVKEVTVPTEKSESELESSDEDVSKVNKLKEKTTIQIKRKAMDELETQYKKKARQLLQATMQQKKVLIREDTTGSSTTNTLKNVFESPETVGKSSKIAVKLQPLKEQTTLEPFTPPTDLSEERLTEEHLLALPIYKNYQIGAPSNKLYIKNLAKDVCEEDLKTLYARFIEIDKLEVKVMQQGRMKGQAFVTFNGLSEVDLEAVVAKALAETNGFVLRQKPMVVCYGKK